MLDRWPEEARRVLESCVAGVKPGDYAVFDADNTLWRYDLTESMMVWLEREGVLRMERMPPHRLPVPCRAGETVWSYYIRLCEQSVVVGYQWAAQCFAGINVSTLHAEMPRMLAHGGPFSVVSGARSGPQTEEILVPQAYLAQRQLVDVLRSVGVHVWIVSASPEELVRVFAREHAGFTIPDQQICGVNLLLRWADGRVDSGSMARDRGAAPWRDASWQEATLTEWPVTPLTWFEGKLAAIRRWIHPHKAPLLVAGDSPNDLPMMREVDRERGIGLQIRAKTAYDDVFAAEARASGGQWISVAPDALFPVRLS